LQTTILKITIHRVVIYYSIKKVVQTTLL